MSETRIDVQVEHKHAPPPTDKKHPNTCPRCGSHYRDDELEAALWVCGHCGHHFPMRARARIDWYADEGSFHEEAADVRSEDPLDFFDLRPYAERLSEAELNTGLGEAAGRAARLRHELGRRAHAGGDPVPDAAAEDGVRGGGPARRAHPDDHRDGASDHRRRARVVRLPW